LRSSVAGTASMLRSNRELALLAGALVVHSIGFSMINPFIPLFAENDIHLDISRVGVLISVWNGGMALAQIPSGRLTDRFGARPLLLAHFVLSSLSWVLYALSWNYESGIATIFFFGIVGALDMPARRTIMIEYATAEAGKATIIGSLDAITGMVGIVGPLIGGVVWAQIGYAAPFNLAGFVNIFACMPLLAIMRSRTRRNSMPTLVKDAPN
jgi:MFS family permease